MIMLVTIVMIIKIIIAISIFPFGTIIIDMSSKSIHMFNDDNNGEEDEEKDEQE